MKTDVTHHLRPILQRYWGFDAFKPFQREAMECVLEGHDSLVVLPTGGGKSLCYQAPALALDGLAVVVSPLISLMKDQVDALKACGAPAACIHSGLRADERRDVANALARNELKILYVAPERIVMTDFADYLKRNRISFIAVDEAHCISHWGHDFRPEYRQLRALKDMFPDIAVHAYTATATPRVRDDICEQLGFTDPRVLVGEFDRPNLFFHSEKRGNQLEDVLPLLERHPGQSGIVYCISRRNVDELTENLRAAGHKVLPYHAGLDDATRRTNQEAFIREEADVIVATVAFGMGIDKSNVRFVIHAAMPKSLEHYQQECGRAGRDGLEAHCYLLYSFADFKTWEHFLQDVDDETRRSGVAKLKDMLHYATTFACRHKYIANYFGQDLGSPHCAACDNCAGASDAHEDSSEIARSILTCVVQLDRFAGPTYASAVLTGSREPRIIEKGHDNMTTWGALAAYTPQQVRRWIETLVLQGHLQKSGQYNILQLTPSGRLLLEGRATARLPRTESAAKKTPLRANTSDDSWQGVDTGLFDALRAMRRDIAEARSVPPFIILSDVTLRDLARRRPVTMKSLMRIQGIGEKKRDDFGVEILRTIETYCESHGLDTEIMMGAPAPDRPKPKRPSRTTEAVFKLFDEGMSIEELMEHSGRARSTVAKYLHDYIAARGITDPAPWVDPDTASRVRDAANELGLERLRPIFDRLDGQVDYERISIVVACMRNLANA